MFDPISIVAPQSISEGETLRAKAQQVLRDAILDGHFEAGQKLVERELSELTGASRSILREALVHLEARCLIERQSYRGFTVATLNANKVKDIFELRAMLETQAAELFTERATDEEIAALRETFGKLEQCDQSFELADARQIKEDFYNILFTGCRNIEIKRALENVTDRIYYLRSQLMMDQNRRTASMVEMKRLTEALATRDRWAARAATLEHLQAAEATVLARMIETSETKVA
jgi:DNA-binding GntR family transcriptional regulator